MRLATLALASLPLAALDSTPSTLGEEEFGNAPVERQPEWADGILEVANDPSRVYRRWINGNEDFCYRGGAPELVRCLKAFSVVEAPRREVILLPTPGGTRSFEDKQVDYGWRLNVPSGLHRGMLERADPDGPGQHASLTVHFSGARPRMVDVPLPDDLTVLGPDELTARLIADVADEESTLRGSSLAQLGRFTYLDPVVETLLAVLRSDEEWLHPTAAAGLASAGHRGAAGIERIEELLAAARATRKALQDDERDWRSESLAAALAKLQGAQSGPRDEDAEEAFALHLERLRKFVTQAAAR